MEFYDHRYNSAVTAMIETDGPEHWLNRYKKSTHLYGPVKPTGSKLSPDFLISEGLGRPGAHLHCTKPGAFTGVMGFPESVKRQFAAAVAYGIRQTHQIPVGLQLLDVSVQEFIKSTHGFKDYAWPADRIQKYDELKPANATTQKGYYQYSDTIAYYDEYMAKEVTWQEGYALFFTLAHLKPLEENIPTIPGDDPRLLLANYLWQKRNKPTYRLWPSWIRTFTQSKMVEFPTNLYVQPYTSIAITLPIANPALLLYKGHAIRSIGLTTFNDDSFHGTAFKGQHLDDGHQMIHLYATTMAPNTFKQKPQLNRNKRGGPRQDKLVQIGQAMMDHIIPQVQCILPLNTNLSLTEQLEKYNLPQDYRDIWAVALTVAYLGTCQYKLIEPDVLGADINKYLQALKEGDLSKISQLHAKATKRRHHLSFNIGRNTDSILKILGRTSQGGGNGDRNGDRKRELNFRHIRRFHFRHIHKNEGPPKERVMPIMEMIIRPDKPEKEYDINFRSLDDTGK